MVASVLQVAKYILSYINCSMTTMKLQKLVYYCQAWSLAWDEVPLFDEDFEAWANGPVCPELYTKHRGMFLVDYSLFNDVPEYNFNKDELETIKSVLDYYGDKDPQWLSELTHKEAPWKEARGNCPPGSNCSNIISKEAMQQYYGGL